MLHRYQYDNFHLHITIIIQITNLIIKSLITNQIKSNVGFWERGKAEYPEKNLSKTAPTVLPTLFAIRVIKMIVPHVVPNNPLHKKKEKKKTN